MLCGRGNERPLTSCTLSSSILLMYQPERGALTVPLLSVVTQRACRTQLEVAALGCLETLWLCAGRVNEDSDPRCPDSREAWHCQHVSCISCTWLTAFWG